MIIWVLVAEMSLKNKWHLANKQGMEDNLCNGHRLCKGTECGVAYYWGTVNNWFGWNEKRTIMKASALWVSISSIHHSSDWGYLLKWVCLGSPTVVLVQSEALITTPQSHGDVIPGYQQLCCMNEPLAVLHSDHCSTWLQTLKRKLDPERTDAFLWKRNYQ